MVYRQLSPRVSVPRACLELSKSCFALLPRTGRAGRSWQVPQFSTISSPYGESTIHLQFAGWRAEWVSGDSTERIFDYVLKKTVKG